MKKATLRKVISGSKFHYLQFDSLKALDDFTAEENRTALSYENKHALEQTIVNSKKHLNTGWFGEGKIKDIEDLERHTAFQKPELFEQVEREIKNSLADFERIEFVNPVPVKKIAYNSLGLGIFSFDRAAMGLTKVKLENGQEKISTTVKDVYAYFLNKPLEQKSVKIYIVAGGTAQVKGKEMLYTGMSACVLADYLTQKNYSVEINVIIGSTPDGENNYMGIIKAKNAEDFLDKNLLAVLTSDPKYFRYKGFKSIIALYNNFGEVVPKSLGAMVRKEDIEKFVQEENTRDCTPIVLQQNYSLEESRTSIVREINRIKKKEHENSWRDN